MEKEKNDLSSQSAYWFIPGGILLGMGIGFLVDNIPAGMFIGLGAGFVLLAITNIFKKK